MESTIVWSEPLPENEQEEMAAVQGDLNMGIVSKQTASEKRGYDWEETEQPRIQQEQANNDTLGA
ncbi:hypothetical protein, partial [Psychrobacter sanguinis]